MIGQTISHYQIKREIGRGGMGVVYLAEDLRLGRQVAVKALPHEVARDPVRRKRFEQEARACAALSHSAIAAVFDLEEAGDELFIIFEFVDGEDLRALIRRGPVPTVRLLALAQGMARGLAVAHGAGIIHRDLKPENIRLTTAGEAKILDFGLARMQPELLSNAATFSMAITRQGSIVGTVGYMSPEQLESRELDARSDIFSLGVMLYEMAAGVHPFQGESPASTIANVLTRDVAPIGQLNPVQPPALDRVVRKCLAKKREERYQNAAELLLDIEDLQRGSGEAMKTAIIAPDAASLTEADSDSLLAVALARVIPNMRRWWEIHHLFMTLAVPAIFPYLAWYMRGASGGQLDLLFFFVVVILAAINFTFRGGMLLFAAFDPGKKLETLTRLGPPVRLTHLLLCLAVVLFTPTFVSRHPLLGTLLAALVIGGILVTLILEPWIERNAFPGMKASGLLWAPGLRPALVIGDLSRLGLMQLLYFASSTYLIVVIGYLQEITWFWEIKAKIGMATWLQRPLEFFIGATSLVTMVVSPVIAWWLLVQRKHEAAAAFRKLFLLVAVLYLGATGGALLFALRYLSLLPGVILLTGMLYGIWYQWLLTRRLVPAPPSSYRFDDDYLRLAVMQLPYIAANAYLLVQMLKQIEEVPKWFNAEPHPPDLYIFGGFTLLSLTSLLFLTALGWGLDQKRLDVVRTFKRWFVLFAFFYLFSQQGAMLALARHTNLFVLLVGTTLLLYGIRYQWIVAKRILAQETEQAQSVSAR